MGLSLPKSNLIFLKKCLDKWVHFTFSIEHFIISETRNKIILVEGKEYIIEKSIYKRYVNNFFNFIFVSREINSCLGNNWLPKKIEYIKQFDISCEYSKMIIEKLNGLKIEFEKRGGDGYKDKLDLFFAREYKEKYIEYTRSALSDIITRINEGIMKD